MSWDLRRAAAQQLEGKAMPYHPAWASNASTSTYSPGATRTDSMISQREAGHHAQAYGGGEAIDWFYDCVNLYADPAGTAPFTLAHADGTRHVRQKTPGTPPDYSVGPQDLYTLLDAPNPFMLYDELLALLVIDLMSVGNGYWYKYKTINNKPLALYRLAPSHVKIKTGAYGPQSYDYQPPGARDPLHIDPVDILHFRRPNPHSAYYGLGVIQGAGRAMDLDIALTDTMAGYYENRADPSLIVQSERRVPRDVFRKLTMQIRNRASGPSNAGALLVLEAGLKASSLSPTASNALFDSLGRMSRDRIMAKFRASPRLFGMLDEQAGSDKVSDFRREFDNSALRPFLTKLSRAISEGLTKPGWGTTFAIDYRTMLPPEDAVKIAGEIAKAPGIKIREVRRQYAQFGIDESTGDPKLDEFVLNKPGPEMDANGQVVDPITGKVVPGQKINAADQPLPGEPGRPPKASNTKGFGSTAAKPTGKALVDAIEAELTRVGAGKAVTNAAGERVTVGNRLQGEVAPQDRFANIRTADLDRVRDRTAADLRDAARALERDLLDTLEGKALKASDLVQRMNRSKAWTTFRDRVEEILSANGRDAAASGVIQSGVVPDEDIDYNDIVKSVINRPQGIRSIIRTLKNRVAERIKDARGSDAERGEFESTIRSVITEWTDGQATMIADTEATHIYNEATLVAAEAAGVATVYVTDGQDDDQPCKDAHGATWSIAEARERRVEHPNCRRAFLPLPEVS